MRKKRGNWDYLLNALDPDFALLQETSPFSKEISTNQIFETVVKKNLRNSIFVKSENFEPLEMPKDLSKGLICARIAHPGVDPIFAVSIYGDLSFSPFHSVFMGLITLIVTTLRDQYSAEHILLSGDFNMDRRMDDNPTKSRFSRKGERLQNTFFDSVLNLGFYDCLRKYDSDYVQTYRHNRGDYPWQIDHMFATDVLYEKLSSIKVTDNPEIHTLSDHNPISAEFDIER